MRSRQANDPSLLDDLILRAGLDQESPKARKGIHGYQRRKLQRDAIRYRVRRRLKAKGKKGRRELALEEMVVLGRQGRERVLAAGLCRYDFGFEARQLSNLFIYLVLSDQM